MRYDDTSRRSGESELGLHAAEGRTGFVVESLVRFLGLLLLCLSLPLHAEVRLPDGQWFEQTDDLRVKVLGGYAVVSRTWLNNRWYFNPAWSRLAFKYDALGQIVSVERAGWSYQAHGPGVWAFDNKNSIVATASGYRWQDHGGNSIDYDAGGHILAYADRNAVKVTFSHDRAGRMTGVFGHFGSQVLWFEYAIAADQVVALQVVGSVNVGQPSAIHDASGRRVEYRYADGRLTTVVDVLGNAWTYGYDGAVRLNSIGDPEKHSTSVAYGANGRVSTVTHADATVTAYGYDYDSAKREVYVQVRHPSGRQEQMWYGLDGVLRRLEVAGQLRMQLAIDGRTLVSTESNGAQTRDELDEWSNLIKRTYADGSVEVFEREPRFSQVLRYVDENGHETRYEYDAKGNVTRRIDAAGTAQARTTEYEYDDYGNRNVAKRLGDAVTVQTAFAYAYDQAGNLVDATDSEGNLSHYTYDIQGNLLTFTDGLSRTWSYAYDAAGQLASETDPAGQVDRYRYDKVGNITAYTNRRGQSWAFDYDARNRLTARTDPLGNVARTEYDPDGLPIREVDEDSRGNDLGYDALKRLSAIRDGRGNVVQLRYPTAPAEQSSSFAPSRIGYPTFEQEMRYDRRSRLTSVSDVLGGDVRLTRYEYDRAGNRIATVNAQGNSTAYEYDALDRLVKATSPEGLVTQLAYDNRDNLVAVTDPRGHVWRYEYDRSNRRVKESKPGGEATVYRYDAADQLVELIDAKGQHLLFEYDGNGRLTKELHYVTDPSGSPPQRHVSYSYDAGANVTGWDDGELSAAFTFDALSRLTVTTVNYGAFSLTYGHTYYANGLKKTLTYPDGTTYGYAYDSNNQLTTVEIPGEGSITVNDFKWTAPTQVTLPGGTVQRHSWDGLLQPIGQEVTSPAATTLVSMSNRYGSMRELLRRDVDGDGTDYSYDREIRLVDAASSSGPRETYTLDPVGNRLANGNLPGPWEYDENNRLRRAGDTTYEYDSNGNLTRQVRGSLSTRFVYDISDRLVSVEDGAGSVIARYGYDPYGRRLWKRVNSSVTYFLHADEGLIGEYNALGQEVAAYGWRPDGISGTDPLFYKLGSRYFYAHTDHLGTPLRLSDKTGVIVWTASYSAYGQATVSPAATVQYNLRLAGQYFDAETGLHQNWLRYYDPATGRYTQYDPLGLAGSINGYAYTDGDPVNLIDPRGDVVPVALGAAAVAAGTLYLKCVAQCAIENAVIALIMGECLNGDTVKPCFVECANPLNWLKVPGKKLAKRYAAVGRAKPPPKAYEVDKYKKLKQGDVVGDGLGNHHVPQKAPAKEIVPGYPQDKMAGDAPAIRLPDAEHGKITKLQEARDTSKMTPRQLLADDIRMLRNNTEAPNGPLRELIDMSKQQNPNAYRK